MDQNIIGRPQHKVLKAYCANALNTFLKIDPGKGVFSGSN